jgi:hypothetical protein
VNAASEDSSEDKSWAVIVNEDNEGKGETYNTLLALMDNTALTTDSKPNVELYNLGTFHYISPSHH